MGLSVPSQRGFLWQSHKVFKVVPLLAPIILLLLMLVNTVCEQKWHKARGVERFLGTIIFAVSYLLRTLAL